MLGICPALIHDVVTDGFPYPCGLAHGIFLGVKSCHHSHWPVWCFLLSACLTTPWSLLSVSYSVLICAFYHNVFANSFDVHLYFFLSTFCKFSVPFHYSSAEMPAFHEIVCTSACTKQNGLVSSNVLILHGIYKEIRHRWRPFSPSCLRDINTTLIYQHKIQRRKCKIYYF